MIDLLAFPFVAVQSSPGLPSATASVNSGFLLNMGSPGGKVCMEDKDMVKAIETNMAKYIQILLEVNTLLSLVLHYLSSFRVGERKMFLRKLTEVMFFFLNGCASILASLVHLHFWLVLL